MQLAPALCWLRRQPRPSSRGRAEVWPTNRRAAGDRPCGDGATQRRWALTALGTCGAAGAILLDRSKNSSRKVEMCVKLQHKSTESWFARLFAINFLTCRSIETHRGRIAVTLYNRARVASTRVCVFERVANRRCARRSEAVWPGVPRGKGHYDIVLP